jgi:hypothetical protein
MEFSKGTDMTEHTQALRRCYFSVFIAMALLTACACNSDSRAKANNDSGASIDMSSAVMCIGDRISNPAEAFHYSYKYSDAGGSSRNDEADVTPQAMDITTVDQSGTHHFHGVRSDEGSWNRAVVDLAHLGFIAMTGRLVPLQGTSAIAQHGSESINGYSTTKYGIDTDNASSADKKKIQTLLGNGSFEKGTAWVAGDGCAAKFVLDEGVWRDGSINKDHFEIARLKK